MALNRTPPPLPWIVKRVIDYGPGRHYRFHVEGENHNYTSDDSAFGFSWSVSSLEYGYDVSGAEWTVQGRWDR